MITAAGDPADRQARAHRRGRPLRRERRRPRGRHTMLLDGDNVRHGLNRDLGFTDADH
jgi:hypothetical protein